MKLSRLIIKPCQLSIQSTYNQSGPPRCRGLFRGIASSAVLNHTEPAKSKQNGGILRSKAPSRGLLMQG